MFFKRKNKGINIGLDLTSKLAHIKSGMKNNIKGYLSGLKSILNSDKLILYVTEKNYNEFKEFKSSNIKIKTTSNDKIIKEINNKKIDIIHFPFNEISFFQKEIPTIVTIHDLIPELFPDKFSKGSRLNLKRFASFADKIITISDFSKKTIMKFYHKSDDSVVTLYVVLNKLFEKEYNDNELQSIKQKYKLPDKFLLYPAAYRPHKNHNILFETAGMIPSDLSFVFTTGETHRPKRFEELKTIANNKYGEDKFKVIGYIDEKDFPAFYSLAEAVILPSLAEGFGYPAIDAMIMKCPVLCSNRTALPEVVGDAGLLFDPTDPEDIAGKVNTLISNDDIKNRLIKNGIDNLKRFNEVDNANKLLQVYKNTVEEKRD